MSHLRHLQTYPIKKQRKHEATVASDDSRSATQNRGWRQVFTARLPPDDWRLRLKPQGFVAVFGEDLKSCLFIPGLSMDIVKSKYRSHRLTDLPRKKHFFIAIVKGTGGR